MLSFSFIAHALHAQFLTAALAILGAYAATSSNPFYCKGGTIYFAAHPVDVLLYQNPDFFHNLYVIKCTTTVLFTSGDRGNVGNFSSSMERGLEDAYSFMAAQPSNETAWNETIVQLNDNMVLFRSPISLPNVQIVYLRLPHGMPDGQAYHGRGGESLQKLYAKDIGNITATDKSATYTLETLKELLSTILEKREAGEIRILDSTTSITSGREQAAEDHADHAVSARLIAEVVKHNDIRTTVRGYASGQMRKFPLSLDLSSLDYEIKAKTFFEYAKYDAQLCQNLTDCLHEAEQAATTSAPDNDDRQYIADWLTRIYYVQ